MKHFKHFKHFIYCLLSFLTLTIILFSTTSPGASAHPGGTDGSGGHTDHDTGEYHYHHGHSAHDHYDMDGDGDLDCPYDFEDKTNYSSGSSRTASSKTDTTVKIDLKTEEPETEQKSFWSILLWIIEHLLSAIFSWLTISSALFMITAAIFDDVRGCSVALILGAVITVVLCICQIVLKN